MNSLDVFVDIFSSFLTLRLGTNVRTVTSRGCRGLNVVAPLPLGVEICLISLVFQVANSDVTWATDVMN